ncbi:glycine zipper domain-containing protein [Adhaeribacter aerolatus]|nr:YMGG-like glycine zipper-containing protein [Adhaeribacter aerolatus]
MKKVSLIFSLILLVAIVITAVEVQAQEKRGWSPQAKGTVIGAGTGAAAGAIIHKRNRVAGGVVGGVVGGAAGYAIGKHKDNKNKEAARVAAANRAAAERAATANRAAKREAVAAKKSSAPAKQAIAANQPAATPLANGFNAANATGMYAAANNADLARILAAGYLPNDHYGDTSKPYHTSEYRRKSW